MASPMTDPATQTLQDPIVLDRRKSHRRILANLDQYVDSGSDRDGTTDDESFAADVVGGSKDADSIVGVAMGQAQIRLKSPTTPAIEKTKALEDSGHYFTVEPESVEPDDEDDRYRKQSESSPERQSSPTKPPSPRQASGSILRSSNSVQRDHDAATPRRKRASSGPTALLQSIRKLLPDLTTPTLPRFPLSSLSTYISSEPDSESAKPSAKADLQPSVSEPTAKPETYHIEHQNREYIQFGLDGNTQSRDTSQRPKTIRRSTSDNSLYLRRAVTGASDFDDTTVFSSVADMPNSRMKAITDSLQDSIIRMPKLPGNFLGSTHGTDEQSEANITRQNTEANKRMSIMGSGTEIPIPRAPQSPVRKETTHPILKDALSRMTGDLVIMGGYRGSILRSAEAPHQQVWIPVKVGLNLRKVDLEVGLTHEDEEKMPEKIIPSGILSHIGPIDISRRLLKKIRKCPQVRSNQLRVHDWGYDWRLSPHLLAGQLIKFLESLESNHPEKSQEYRGAMVIAHSLGGLITRHAVNQRPDLFAGVVYAGVPQNCVNILGPLRNGDDVLLSSRVLTAQVNFTLRTSFALLPENGRCFLNKETGERYDVDFFDVKSWDELRLSPCINPPLPIAMKRKSLVGSISESITSFHPSLPTKRGNLFSSNDSHAQTIKEKTEDIKNTVENGLKSTAETSQDTVGQSLEPSMKPATKPSIATTVTIPRDKAYEYLERTLSEIKCFKTELAHRQDHQDSNLYPPQAVIFGQGVPTVYGAKVTSREAIKYSDAYDDLAFASGDGVVLASAAQLPSGYRCVKGGRVKSDRGHVGLLGDLEGIGQCLGAIVEGRKRGIGRGPEHSMCR